MSFVEFRRSASGVVLLALFILMAAMTPDAQALWRIEGKHIGVGESELVSVSPHETGKLLVPSLKLEISCSKFEAEKLTLVLLSTEASGKINFTGCTTVHDGKAVANCNPLEPIVAGGRADLVLSEGINYILVKSTGAGALLVIEFDPTKCALVEDSEITGSIRMRCLTEELKASDCANEQVTHLLTESAGFSGDQMFIGEHQATLDGITAVKLAGAQKSKKWSGTI